jgi:uncharacterized protein YidB (DUF937 family)
MGLLDDLMRGSGGLGAVVDLVTRNPQLLHAAVSLLSSKEGSGGGPGGLAGLVKAFEGGGLGDMMSSWVSTGPNPPVSPDQLASVLGPQTLSEFAAKAGMSHADAGSALSTMLPVIIDRLTPHGQVPDNNSVEATLGGLLKMLGQ